MTTPASSTGAAKAHPTQKPTAEKLAELACILSRTGDESPGNLVSRALEIWHASCDALSETKRPDLMEIFSFVEIAEHKLLPAIRKSSDRQSVDSGKGVEKAFGRYFETVIAGYEKAMKGRRVSAELMRSNKSLLTELRNELIENKRLPKHILDLLKQFQINMRGNRHNVSAMEIRELLGGADVGLPGTDL